MGSSDVSPIDVLKRHKVIAVVGASKNPEKDAYIVPAYLKQHGYVIVPINPTADSILGEKAYPSLVDLPRSVASTVDVVEVFRPSEELPKVALDAAEMKRRTGRPLVFWAQLGLESEEAKRILSENGISYVMNACMRVVHSNHISQGHRKN
jgi:hypothetical protein